VRLAVVSPFLDRSHGTERCIVEQIERLARLPGWEIHVYSQRVEQAAGMCRDSSPAGGASSPGKIVWHKIPKLPGPHLLSYVWWFAANHVVRWRDRRSGRVRPDLVYSPGINCADADVIAVHIVFREFYRRVRGELRLRKLPLGSWPRTLHRKFYYRLIMGLEGWIYRDSRNHLTAVSHLAARQLEEHFQRAGAAVIPNAVDAEKFHPSAREQARSSARSRLNFSGADFVLLLIGNDWKNKGLDALLRAMAACADLPLRLLVVGSDDASSYQSLLARLGLRDRVRFAAPCADVLPFYAAADAYAGPSLEDAFGLPVLEAMACGLPVITSAWSGVSELIRDGVDGFILQDGSDAAGLARRIRQLCQEPDLRRRIGENAAHTAQAHTWDRNAREIARVLSDALERKRQRSPLRKETAR
jgi:glycosyltransferase involved in cell wall biosynthesis